jgi:tRNA(fMet)-specific endonuclease VapC
MAEGGVLIDTNVIIDSFRGKQRAKEHLDALRGKICISSVTVLELYRGARSQRRKDELQEQLKAYAIIEVDTRISAKAVEVMKKYNSGNQDVFVADCLIAATAMVHGLPLLTYNTRDFDFIKELVLYQF